MCSFQKKPNFSTLIAIYHFSGIKAALNAPKSSTFSNEQIRPGGKASIDADALGIRSQMQQYKDSHSNGSTNHQTEQNPDENSGKLSKRQYGKFDSTALHIQHALRQTEVQRKYSKKREEPIEAYLDREEQVQLEVKQKEEEDR